MLIFQLDSVLCGSSTYSLDHFLEWDFIGALHVIPLVLPSSYNGGLSLRKKSKMLELISLCSQDQHFPRFFPLSQNEDVWFAKCWTFMASAADKASPLSIHLPPSRVANAFAVQDKYDPSDEIRPLGVHKPWPYMNEQTMAHLVQYCPDLCHILPFKVHQTHCHETSSSSTRRHSFHKE